MSLLRIERELVDIGETLARAKAESRKFRSDWNGDAEQGNYVLRTPLGTIAGTYSVEARTVCFLVKRKPWIIPGALIERVLDEFLRAG